MSDNTTLPVAAGGDTIRTLDKTGTGAPKTEVVALDLGGGDGRSEFIASFPLPTAPDIPRDDDDIPLASLSPSTMDSLEMLFRQTIAAIGAPYPQTAAEAAAGVTPTNMALRPGWVRRYGANTIPGSTDMSSAFTQALASNPGYVYFDGPGPYYMAQLAPFNMLAGQSLYGDGAVTLVQFQSSATDNIRIYNINSCTVRDITFQVLGTNQNSYTGVVSIKGTASYCNVERVNISGTTACGILVNGTCQHNVIRACSFTNFNLQLTAFTFTAPPVGSSATLSVAWAQASGTYPIVYSDGETRAGTFTNGLTTCTWSPALTGTPTASAQVSVASNDATADIYVTSDSVVSGAMYNIIDGNNCFGGNWHGIILLNAPASIQQSYNVVCNNRVGQHLAYGIADYTNNTADTFTQIIGNYVENIQGSVISGGNAGAGIYVIGAGGVVVSGNTVRNCCQATAANSLIPAGIGVGTATATVLSPIVVEANHVSGMTQYHGIAVKSSTTGPVNVTGNSIVMPAANVTGYAISATDVSNFSVVGNTIKSLSPSSAINMNAASLDLSGIAISDNIITHTAGKSIEFIFSAAHTFTQVVVTGNQVTTPGSNYNLLLQNIIQGTVTGNVCSTTGSAPLSLSACTQIRCSNNVLINTGQYAVFTSGTCTGSVIDETNYLSGSNGIGIVAVNNAGTGCTIRQLGTAPPNTGTQAAGDVVINTAGVAPEAWICTLGGTFGTFTSNASFGAYAPGAFYIPTGNYLAMTERLQLTGTQRGTLKGTARLRIN